METEKFVKEGKLSSYYVFPINRLIERGVKVYPVLTKNLSWCDIDDKEDLERARKMLFNGKL